MNFSSSAPPASRATASSVAITSGIAESLEERERLCSVSWSPSVIASPSEVDVSTRSSKSGLNARGPVGTSATASSSDAVAASLHGSDAASPEATETETPASVFA